MKMKAKLHTQAYKYTQLMLGYTHPSSLALCQEAICLGKTKRDLVCTLAIK